MNTVGLTFMGKQEENISCVVIVDNSRYSRESEALSNLVAGDFNNVLKFSF